MWDVAAVVPREWIRITVQADGARGCEKAAGAVHAVLSLTTPEVILRV
jgi:hypothetical protein